jgi:hypothetical protein
MKPSGNLSDAQGGPSPTATHNCALHCNTNHSDDHCRHCNDDTTTIPSTTTTTTTTTAATAAASTTTTTVPQTSEGGLVHRPASFMMFEEQANDIISGLLYDEQSSQSTSNANYACECRSTLTAPNYEFKIIVVGAVATGKTSLIQRYIHPTQKFQSVYKTTVCVPNASQHCSYVLLRVLHFDHISTAYTLLHPRCCVRDWPTD